MEIGLIYSQKDPRQTRTRDFLRQYLKERGVQAQLTESIKEVDSPTVIINGHTLEDQRREPRSDSPEMYPNIKTIAQILERQFWCL